MFLTIHAASGLVIGKYTGSVLPAFLIGFVSHIILDMIPHDPVEMDKWKMSEVKKFMVIEFFIEFPLIAIMLAALTWSGLITWSWVYVAAIVGAVAMDFLWGMKKLVPKCKIFGLFEKINHLSHIIFAKNYHIRWQIWLPLQVLLLVIFLLIYLW